MWLVDSFECTMMHGLTTPKFRPTNLVVILCVGIRSVTQNVKGLVTQVFHIVS
jgi:hypothetical protein